MPAVVMAIAGLSMLTARDASNKKTATGEADQKSLPSISTRETGRDASISHDDKGDAEESWA
jgi:hypothetical protein